MPFFAAPLSSPGARDGAGEAALLEVARRRPLPFPGGAAAGKQAFGSPSHSCSLVRSSSSPTVRPLRLLQALYDSASRWYIAGKPFLDKICKGVWLVNSRGLFFVALLLWC
ncbi:hypothetical protein BT93_D1495 [Corymbia citriodora subsp. variegata]|nr:hypothetical protein BT93_D1495 [Corymbia citriodora subsp. variegata]